MQSANAEAFAEEYIYFLVSASAKRHDGIKNAEAIKFLGNLKKYVSKNKIYFYLKERKKCSAK